MIELTCSRNAAEGEARGFRWKAKFKNASIRIRKRKIEICVGHWIRELEPIHKIFIDWVKSREEHIVGPICRIIILDDDYDENHVIKAGKVLSRMKESYFDLKNNPESA